MSMEVSVEHLGDVKFAIKARSHTIVCDQPAENGGHDEGMTPPELMLASLASCAGFYAAAYLKKKGLATGGTLVRVTAGKATAPARLDDFHIEVSVPVAINEEQRTGLEQAIHHCLIHNTLLHPPTIEIAIRSALSASVGV